jgi:hypothetical protein
MYVPLLTGLYSGLPQRIPMNLLHTVNAPINYNSWTIFRVISAYTLQCIYFIYTVNVPRLAGLEFRITSAYIPMHLLYTVNVPLLAGLYSGLPQRIPMNLLYTVNVPLLAGLYSGLPQRIPMHLLYTVNVPSC